MVIAFDYTGVIMPGPIVEWVKRNISPDDNSYLFMVESADKWDRGEITLDEAYQRMSLITGVAPEAIWQTFFESSLLDTEVVAIIKKLKEHYRIALFSNHIGELLRKVLAMHQITNLFDEILVSSEHKMKKPDPQFFAMLLSVMHVEKDEVVLVDDTQTNIQAACHYGIKALLYKNPTQLLKDFKRLGITV